MKKIIKKTNSVNLMLISKKAKIYYTSFFLIIFFVISYAFLLFFNVQYAYAIKHKETDITQYQNFSSSLQSKYLTKISEIEENIKSEEYVQLKKVVYLDNSSNRVVLNTEF